MRKYHRLGTKNRMEKLEKKYKTVLNNSNVRDKDNVFS